VAARIADLRGDPRLRGFGVTRRHVAGAHVAWQLFALPYAQALSAPAGWRDAERAHGERVIADDGAVVTLLAWAPRAPFETWVMPARGLGGFEQAGPEVIAAVASAVDRALALVAGALRAPPVDVVVVDGEPWRVELVPRLRAPEAVEIATGVPVHGVFPEAAAEYLREAWSDTRTEAG
jgi:galactose-1-phosphate uridylyltransferase